ncbi:MAG: CapA family protein [Syntrophomonadaceae bacterium]|nr:CapA family protein [Syntrophomonadaceae bacterium]
MKKTIFFVVGLILAGILAALVIFNYSVYPLLDSKPVISVEENPPENEKLSPRIETVTLTAAGDCLMHNTQIAAGLQPDGSYSFPNYFKEVEDLLREGDYTSVCFEAPLAGAKWAYTGYPIFNSPDEIANTFKDSGFDLVITANNHILDRGIEGGLRTLQVLQDAGLDTIGTYLTEADSQKLLIKNIRGVKVGYLAYSYGTNGIPIPAGYEYFFNFLDKEQIFKDIERIRPQVDALVVFLHWGIEYTTKPTPEQEILAKEILEMGADAIIGSHPHVIQPMEIFEINGQKKLVAYAIGNFISHQRGVERNSGIVLKLKFTKNFEEGKTVLEEVSYTPTFSHHYYDNGKMDFRVVPVEDTIANILQYQEPFLSKQDLPVLEEVLNTTTSRLGEPYYAK